MLRLGYKIRLVVALIIFILCVLGILGVFYPIKILDLEFSAVLQRVFIDFSIVSLILTVSVAVLTLIAGRFYCSCLCPMGFLQELVALILRKENEYVKNYPVKYFIAAVVFGLIAGGSALVIKYIEPYTLFASALTVSIVSIIIIVAILALVFFKNRLFCTNICPVGTILGLLAKNSLCKIHISEEDCMACGLCERNCPAGSINVSEQKVDNETCLKCLKCIEICPKEAMKFGIKQKEETTAFSIKRRSLIIAASTAVVLGGMIKAGKVLKDKIAEKIKNIMLPPGAESAERFVNRCYNCNLCINNCPQKIIVKANSDFPAVHLDYTQGHCEKDCNKCSEVCPTGAIKRLSLGEKQKTQIGVAVIDKKACVNCQYCHSEIACPYGAIFKQGKDKPVVDVSKCVGCGKCKSYCYVGAINIIAVKKQSII